MPRKDASKSPPGRRRLGRGLTSLMSTAVPIETAASPGPSPPPSTDAHLPPPDEGEIRLIGTEQIRANPKQPRQHFDEQSLEALAASIRTAGLMQPLVVRPDATGGFQLIVGERRWRAAQRIGLARIPAVIRELDDQAAAEWALIENIQREDLNPLERADAFRRLTDEFGLTHQQVADQVGLDRSTITTFLRLHDLDDVCRNAVRSGQLTHAHARELLALTNIDLRQQTAQMAIRQDWSVRTLKSRVKSLLGPRRTRTRTATSAAPAHRLDLERRLGEHLGTKIQVQPGKQKGAGRLVIDFYTHDQFEGLMQRLGFDTDTL